MKTSKRILSVALTCLLIATTALTAMAQDETRRSELGIRQLLVQKKMLELETKVTVIAEKLREKEPKRAELLVAAYQQSKEQLITKKMEEASTLLDKGQFKAADSLLDEVVVNIESLVRLLTQSKDKEASAQEEIRQLEHWKKQIEKVQAEQIAKRNELEKVSDKEKAIDKLAGQIKRLKGLIEEQKAVIDDTKDKTKAGLRALDKVADKQFDVRKKTQELKDEIAGLNKPSEGEPNLGDGKPQDGKPQDGKPQDGKPQDGKPQDGKPQDGKPQDGKPEDGKPEDGKPEDCLLYTSPSPRDATLSRMPSSA